MSLRSCEDVRELLEMKAYGLLDDPGTAGDAARLETHLAACEACRETLAAESAVTASLAAIGRLQTTTAVEDRVMAMVRATPVAPASVWRLTRKQKTVLGGAAAIGTLVELALWVAVVLTVLRIAKVPSFFSPEAAQGFGQNALIALAAVVEVAVALARAAMTVVGALAPLVPAPELLAVLFLAMVSSVTFVAVRRDLRRSPAAARGLR